METRTSPRGIEIAPFRGLRYLLDGDIDAASRAAKSLTSAPYDVITPEEHRRLLAVSPHNITHLTLGSRPGEASSYEARGDLLRSWVRDGVLVRDEDPCFYVYVIDYPSMADRGKTVHFRGLIALGRLHPFEEGVVLPHERTFPKVVDDRLSLLEATRTNLESIFLLYSDSSGEIDRILEAHAGGNPVIRVEAKPGETHSLHPVTDVAAFIRLTNFLATQRPIIADGHHRYTTSLRYWTEGRTTGNAVPGAEWQMMTFANLHGDGLSILATHRLIKLKDRRAHTLSRTGSLVPSVVASLLSKFETAEDANCDLWIETRERKVAVRFPETLSRSKSGVARTSYALVHDVVLKDWLGGLVEEEGIRYFKEGTGEHAALEAGEGDILFRMRPVDPREFQDVVQGGEVFPHKTTYFYPKLWSGLVLWPIEEPERLALK